MPVNDIYEFVVITQQAAQAGMCVLHYRVTASTPPEPSIDAIVTPRDTSWHLNWKALLSTQATYRGTTGQRIRPAPPGPKGIAIGNAAPGAVAGDPLPKQVSAILRKRTALGGRRTRGRNYVPFPAEADNPITAQPSPAFVLTLQALCDVLIAPFTVVDTPGSITMNLVVFSRTPPEQSNLVTSCVAVDIWATQRRRGDFGRTNIAPI